MIEIRKGKDRGHVEHGWLDARHSFSFGDYHDPARMSFGCLRVINEDRVQPAAGFPPHSHRDMEIITYVLEGALRHRDSTGGGSVLKPGELQVMHAGRGIQHSEFNDSQSEGVHLLQIWIEPKFRGVAPGYEQGPLNAAALRKGFTLAMGSQQDAAPFHIHQDARLSIAWPAAGTRLKETLDRNRLYYLHLARGDLQIGEQMFEAGDAVAIQDESGLELIATTDAEVLLFNLPADSS